MAIEYLNGINWICEYYFNGWKGVNLRWYYRYYRSPLFLDIYNTLGTMINENDFTRLTMWKAQENNTFFNVFEQLLSVLPISSKNLLPIELQFLVDVNSPIGDYYPTD